ncbi:hypothetical protein [Xylanibacter oryzae]|uniref:hypothetical protein n=1 Tax=Xylanibacter oryzae TaxID=185293 RepID=UPI000562DC9A|nr:hypothetical protein [Xylanibacter oryzae]
MDSISDLNKRDKKDYQKQEFLMLLRQSEKGIMLYITQCYIDKDTFKDYHPLGCVIKNDSYFYIVNQGISNDSLNSIFKKTDNKIIPYIMKEQDIDADVYFVYRESRLFRLINGFFRRE